MHHAWYVKRTPQNQGPLSFAQLQSLAANGELKSTDRVGRKGMAKWAAARSIAGLFPQQEEVAAEAVVEERAMDAATVEPPPVSVATATSTPAKNSAAPWILAGVAGGGVLVLGCSGLLCAGLMLFVAQSEEFAPVVLNPDPTGNLSDGDSTGQPLVSELPTTTYAEPAAWQPAPETPAAAPVEPSISPVVAEVVAKADGGNAEAMYELSFRYLEGTGVAADNGLALSWLTKAAEAGHADAMNDLAYRYVKGDGVAENPEQGAHWFGKGAEAGSGMAMYNYAICHGNGVGVPQNEFLCRQWIMRSAQSGYEPAQKYVEEMKAQLAANLFGAIAEDLFGGGGDGGGDTSAEDADREYWNARRRSQDYWTDRAERAAAAGNQMDYDYSRTMIP